MNIKIAAIAMVKDECDIIELFVKINSRSVTHIFIVDHCSQDGTLEILLQLKAMGYGLTIYKHESLDFQQQIILTTLARQIAATNEYDFIVPLDADEFIYASTGNFAQAVYEEIPKNGCGMLAWATYVPAMGDYYSTSSPLYNAFRRRNKEYTQFYKVVIPNELAKNCTIAEGNHLVAVNNQLIPGTTISPILQHVPVRSVDQIIAKALIGSHKLSIKVGRGKSEGLHWDHMANKIRQKNYQLNRADMLEIAFLYAGDMTQPIELPTIDETAPRIGLPDDCITFDSQSRINLIKKFDMLASKLCNEIQIVRNIN